MCFMGTPASDGAKTPMNAAKNYNRCARSQIVSRNKNPHRNKTEFTIKNNLKNFPTYV